MLYVFYVDTGMMLTFDMNVALDSVSNLKQVIARTCKIPQDKQVLLISGGESLMENTRVASYSAGTDTNPIFLFSKNVIESAIPPPASVDYDSDEDLKEQVEGCLSLTPSYDTVVARAQLAQQFHELACKVTRICQGLVHDQHLQQQGWAAVVANLEDVTSLFKSRLQTFSQRYRMYLEKRKDFIALLENFDEDLQLLSRIPLLSNLLSASSGTDQNGEEKQQSLLYWISSSSGQAGLEEVADFCRRGIEQMDEMILAGLTAEVQAAEEAASNSSMKEIKGLEERLYGLEQLMCETKKLVQDQAELAQSICEIDNKLLMYHESVKRLQKHLKIVQQIHLAPQLYLSAVREVVRRRNFSKTFLEWACNLATEASTIHNSEVSERKIFNESIEGHFLYSLFPGMDDFPPPFAIYSPEPFDMRLPELRISDMENLRDVMPSNVRSDVPCFIPWMSYPLAKIPCKSNEESPGHDLFTSAVEAVVCSPSGNELARKGDTKLLAKEMDFSLHGSCKEELQTELVKKSCEVKLLMERQRSMEYCIKMLKGGLKKGLSDLVQSLQNELKTLKQQVRTNRAQFWDFAHSLTNEVNEALSRIQENFKKEKECAIEDVTGPLLKQLEEHKSGILQLQEQLECRQQHVLALEKEVEEKKEEVADVMKRLTLEHEVELDKYQESVKQQQEFREEEITALQLDMSSREKMIEILQCEKEKLLEELHSKQEEKDESLDEIRTKIYLEFRANTEKLRSDWEAKVEEAHRHHETQKQELEKKMQNLQKERDNYKLEMDNLRSRFKLLHSETLGICVHESVVDGLKKENETLTTEVESLRTKQASRLQLEADRQTLFNEALRKATKEKEEEILRLTRQELFWRQECERLAELLRVMRHSDCAGASTSTSTVSSSLSTCRDKDIVLVVWDESRGLYKVQQDGPMQHFVHHESLPILGLTTPPSNEKYFQLTAQVMAKEYCRAKKVVEWTLEFYYELLDKQHLAILEL
ncbi:unnamed protein product [Darwinula stevensoni]|uniref:RB1-inducible coiled-coil protein 1 n=1 Tax=Darwinula stevensoni TaxID=69355 RepID=A0A7R9A2W0_9CRUS|nr:unnamed protein product [Darwinula stevensoni]CAG0886467.1 unnamed protein product [Darwinula stevensoni]